MFLFVLFIAVMVLVFLIVFGWVMLEEEDRNRRNDPRAPGARERYVIQDGIVFHIDPPEIRDNTQQWDLKARDIPQNWVFPKYWEDS